MKLSKRQLRKIIKEVITESAHNEHAEGLSSLAETGIEGYNQAISVGNSLGFSDTEMEAILIGVTSKLAHQINVDYNSRKPGSYDFVEDLNNIEIAKIGGFGKHSVDYWPPPPKDEWIAKTTKENPEIHRFIIDHLWEEAVS